MPSDVRPAAPSVRTWLQLFRPQQWIKNVLVFAAPAAAGVLNEADHLARASCLFVAFCLAASGGYCLNDAADAEADRAHPKKCRRPVASGAITRRAATVVGIILLLAGLGLAALTTVEALAILGTYVVLQPLYSWRLKHIAVVDLIVVAAGFVLRAVIGVAGTDVPISNWYLIVASFGSLFLVAGKRSTELGLEQSVGARRRSLEAYTAPFLLLVRGVALSITLLAYCLWAFEKADLDPHAFPWFELSVVPFTAALLRYTLVHEIDQPSGPEEVVLRDRPLQVIGLLWAVCLVAGVYVGDAPPLTG